MTSTRPATCVIIEDEPLAMERVRSYVGKIPFLTVLATFDNAIDGYEFLKSSSVDILFLDINVGEISGIQLLETTRLDCHVILTTAYSEYALKGYDLRVADYLLKPFTFERLLQAVDRVQTLRQASLPTSAESKPYLFIKVEHRLEKIFLQDIVYIEGAGDYRTICLRENNHHRFLLTLQTLQEFEQMVPPEILCRVHKSYMVAIRHIVSVERDRIRLQQIVEPIPISETYKERFHAVIR